MRDIRAILLRADDVSDMFGNLAPDDWNIKPWVLLVLSYLGHQEVVLCHCVYSVSAVTTL